MVGFYFAFIFHSHIHIKYNERMGWSMNERLLYNQLFFVRSLTCKALENIPDDLLDVIPKGAVNNLRWNFGHIYTSQNLLLSKFAGFSVHTPEEYITFFKPKTNPANWHGKPPTIHEIATLLKNQTDNVVSLIDGKLNEKLKKPFNTGSHGEFTTVYEIVNFALYHEGHHTGVINTLKRILEIDF
jgi:uncharacterized damage-inducible protein DinB